MYTLGLSFGFHDSAVALLHNDQLVYASHEERLSLSKHDDSFPALAIDKALAENGLELRDINRIAYYESPELKFTRILSSSLAEYPFGIKDFCYSMQSWLSHKIWLRTQLEKYFQLDADKIDFFEHHDSHAMQAFVGSGFYSAAILVIDAVGEWATSSIYQAKYKDQKFFLEKKWQQDFPHSLGLFYSAMTAYLGFQPMNDECSLMALAAFGKPRFYEQLKQLVFDGDLETFHINNKFLNFNRYVGEPFTTKFTHTVQSALV
ncbi:MAG: hypothetical protein KBD78_01475 [Oligoflexales bacterium]|nr:hypothetical protein [Oligoflexales bacterium]